MTDKSSTPPPVDIARNESAEPDAAHGAVRAPLPVRRTFLSAAASIFVGIGLLVTPLVAGLITFFDPLIRKRASGGTMIDIGTTAELPNDTTPVQFQVIGEKVDAWTRSVAPLGSVYVRRKAPGSDELIVLHATCPHAGCFVNLSGTHFQCPCHNSVFHLDGSRGDPCVSPRGMDELDYELTDDGTIRVKFQDFLAGKKEQVPV